MGQAKPQIVSQTLEAIKGGGGSIKVGTTGTINALMSRELQSVKTITSTIKSPNRAMEPNDVTTGTSPKTKVKAVEASTSNNNNTTNNAMNEKHTIVAQKAKHHHARQDSRNPFLRSDSADGNGTPIRRKNEKKGSCMVEIVDIKCGVPDKMWANPITNKLRKLTFSKLSEPNGIK